MWYHGFGNQTRLELGASPRLLAVFLLIHTLVALAILLADLPLWFQLPLLLINALAFRQHLLCWAFPFLYLDAVTIELGPQGRFRLLDGDNKEVGEWYLQRVVWGFASLMVIRLVAAGGRRGRWLVLSPDAVCPRGLRRLRARLRWAGISRERGPFRRLGSSRPVGR